MNIGIISTSVRKNAQSPRVAKFFHQFIETNQLGSAEIIDLARYEFPIFEERLKFMDTPPENLVQLSELIKSKDALIIISPEYNGAYPASLKNIIDVFNEEWKRKPIAISMVSAGPFAGNQLITSLLFPFWKIGALMVPSMFPIAQVQLHFDENGKILKDEEGVIKRATAFVNELIWYAEKIKS
jgi:NAD(P)H-dependent FMN reductase